MTVLGAVVRPQLPPERLRAMARVADEAGLEELWLWEDCFLEGGISSAAAVLAWTERIRVGVGLLPVPLRNVAVTAMEAATLHRMFPGRVVLGVGHGVQDWMGQVGARTESPLTLLREYVVALRGLLRGERITTQGRYVTLDDVALGWPPERSHAEVLVGAIGPRTIRLSGEVADGTVLNESASPERVREVRRIVDRACAADGRTGSHKVVVYLLTATGDDAETRLQGALTGAGLSASSGLGVAGDASDVAKAVRRYADAGADTVVLLPTADEPDPEGFLRFVAEDVRPLIQA